MTTRWAPAKKDTLRALATEILHNYAKGRAFVAVDGLADAGQAALADDLAAALVEAGHPAFRASVGDFLLPRADAGAGAASGPAPVDGSLLRRALVEPFRLGGSTAWVPAAFDSERQREVEPRWVTGPDDALLVVDGEALGRPELAGLWNYTVWVTAGGTRGGLRAGATAVVDVTDPEHPRRVFDDAC